MVALAREIEKDLERGNAHRATQTIMLVERDTAQRQLWTQWLEKAGFGLICGVPDTDRASFYLQKDVYNLIFVTVAPDITGNLGLDFVARIRQQGFGGRLVVMSECPTLDLCYRVARIGADDFLVKSPQLKLAAHAIRLTEARALPQSNAWRPESILATGLFASMGITHCELRVLEEFARGFPRQQTIARNMDKDNVYVRKVFSRIYKKLDAQMAVRNQAQLSHLLTICSLFN